MKLNRKQKLKLCLFVLIYILISFFSVVIIDNFIKIEFVYIQSLMCILQNIITGCIVFTITKHYIVTKICFIDKRTGLYTSQKMEMDLKELAQYNKPYGVYFLDLDNFKDINDTFGHHIGDKVLKFLAENLISIDGVTAYRYGGDEFVIIAKNTDLDKCKRSIESFSGICYKAIIESKAISIEINFSGAMSRFPQDGTSPEVLLKYADHRQYIHKKAKKQESRC